MLRIGDLVVRIAVDIIGKEPHRLHVAEQPASVRQQIFLEVGKKGRLSEVAARVGLEDLEIDVDIIEVRIILQPRVRSRTHEIAEIAQHKARHHGIQVHDTDRPSGFIKEHIIDLRIAMVDMFFQLSFAEEHLRQTHGSAAPVDPFDDIRACRFPSGLIGCQSLIQFLQTELHIMEIRDRLA